MLIVVGCPAQLLAAEPRLTGLRTRDSFEVGLTWDGGKLTKIKIHSVGGRNVIV